jgi:hypothetical protein
MSMSNSEIIFNECMLIGFEYTGNNLYTFAEWQERGYKIVKGSTAVIKTKLWKPVTTIDKETGKESKSFIMVAAALFSDKQVEPMSDKLKDYISNKKENKQPGTKKKEKKNFINVTKQVAIA